MGKIKSYCLLVLVQILVLCSLSQSKKWNTNKDSIVVDGKIGIWIGQFEKRYTGFKNFVD